MTRTIKTTLSAAVLGLALVSSPALAGEYPTDFSALDTDGNGQVTFAEYSAVVKANGVSTTAAAQQFTRISAGDATITEDEFNLGLAFQDQPYALQAVTDGQQNVSYVGAEVDMSAPEFEPQVSEVQDSPVADSEPYVVQEVAPVEAAPSDISPAEPIISDTPDAVMESTTPDVQVITEPVPETIDPTTTSTQPEIIIDAQEPELPAIEMPEVDATEPEAEDILEEELEPQPEG